MNIFVFFAQTGKAKNEAKKAKVDYDTLARELEMERNHANENKRAATMSARSAEEADRRLLVRVGGYRYVYV